MAVSQNEFYSQFTNLLITQYLNASLEFTDPLAKAFYKADVTNGAEIGMYTANSLQSHEYDDSSNLLTVFSNETNQQTLETTDTIFFATTNNKTIGRGAFSSETNLAIVINYIVSMLAKSKEMYTYDKIIDAFNEYMVVGADGIKGTQQIPVHLVDTSTLTGNDKIQAELLNSRLTYKSMLLYARRMQRPNTNFNELGYKETTNPRDIICIINDVVDTDLTVDVLASLLNSDKITEAQRWSEKIFIPADEFTNPNTLCYLMDRNAYLIANRILVATAFFNARTLNTTNFYHIWLIRGFVKGLQKIALVGVYDLDYATASAMDTGTETTTDTGE